jgi:hypothetical protein
MEVRRPARATFAAATLAILLIACGGDNGVSPPGPPAGIDIAAGNNQVGTVGAAVATAPQVRIRDAQGRGISGISVRFDVVDGGGSVSGDSVVTDAQGVATVGQWRLGPVPGNNTLRAQALGHPLLTTITATSGPGAPSSIQIVQGGAGLTAIVAQEVIPRPSVRIRDAFGNPVPGILITWSIVQGAGTVVGGPTTTDTEGRTTVGGWILGPEQGVNQLRARTPNGIIATFTATSIGIPSALEPAVATVQQGFSSFPVPLTARVRVRDAEGGNVVGIPVVFRVVGGGGSIKGDTVATGSDGVAALGDWRLDAAGSSTVEAFVPGFPGPVVQFQASGTVSPFTIDLRFIGVPPADLRDEFVRAAMRWMQVIVGDLPDATVSLAAGGGGQCLAPQMPAVNGIVDDMIIFANIATIDGPGNILGSAGPCDQRPNGDKFPTVGYMQFDVADAALYNADGRFFSIAAHEMGHVLGIGTVWNSRGLITGAGGSDPVYTGAGAVTEWPTLDISYAGTPVPAENDGGTGTRDVHWRESVLNTELMTGYVEGTGVAMPLSRVTIGALVDLGYTVDLSKADPFVASLLAGPTPEHELIREILFSPEWRVDANGNRIPRP